MLRVYIFFSELLWVKLQSHILILKNKYCRNQVWNAAAQHFKGWPFFILVKSQFKIDVSIQNLQVRFCLRGIAWEYFFPSFKQLNNPILLFQLEIKYFIPTNSKNTWSYSQPDSWQPWSLQQFIRNNVDIKKSPLLWTQIEVFRLIISWSKNKRSNSVLTFCHSLSYQQCKYNLV